VIQFSAIPDRIFYCVSYAVFALPLILFYTFFIPPFQVPDESSHFARAYQLTQGEFFPTKQPDPGAPGGYTVGGTVDLGIFLAAEQLIYLQFNAAKKFSMNKAVKVERYKWQHGERADTRNVSVYAPTFYLVPAVGILVGQHFDMSIVQSLKLSRLLSGLFAVLLICIAMLKLRKGHGIFFVILLMPMTLAQLASSSQDATCLAVAALCVALLSQLNPEMPQRKRRMYLFFTVALLISLASSRPPYLALSLFYLHLAFVFRGQAFFVVECCLAFIATLLVTVLWSLYVALYVSVPFGLEGANYAQQALFVLQSPLDWLEVLAKTWQLRWNIMYKSYIGVIGHLDTAFPSRYYHLTVLTLCLAFLMSFLSEQGAFFRSIREQALVPGAIVLATIVGIFLVLYISWSPLYHPFIEGVQGRYFIPATLFVALGAANNALNGRTQVVYRCIMLAFATGTLLITPYVVMVRYY
jgi:uncharacterized membrane protein